jgi:PTS system mannose-specific IIC component
VSPFALDIIIISVIGGLLSLDRRAAMQLMVSQPLLAATIVGASMGNVEQGMYLGVILQLLWMSCVLFGANIPRNDTLATVTISGAYFLYAKQVDPTILDIHHFAGCVPSVVALAILIGSPTCILGQWMDVKLDHLNLSLASEADQAASEGLTRPISFIVFLAIVRTFVANSTATAVTTVTAVILLVECHSQLSADVIEALNILSVYLLPALGLAVSLSLVRKRRALLLAGITFFVVATAIAQARGMG